VVKDEKKDFLNELTKLVRKNTGEVDRLKLVALITIEVHNRDIIESLIKTCFSPTSFEWLK
jgi:dynein heavy chain